VHILPKNRQRFGTKLLSEVGQRHFQEFYIFFFFFLRVGGLGGGLSWNDGLLNFFQLFDFPIAVFKLLFDLVLHLEVIGVGASKCGILFGGFTGFQVFFAQDVAALLMCYRELFIERRELRHYCLFFL
jgi:hypothetical protein